MCLNSLAEHGDDEAAVDYVLAGVALAQGDVIVVLSPSQVTHLPTHRYSKLYIYIFIRCIVKI